MRKAAVAAKHAIARLRGELTRPKGHRTLIRESSNTRLASVRLTVEKRTRSLGAGLTGATSAFRNRAARAQGSVQGSRPYRRADAHRISAIERAVRLREDGLGPRLLGLGRSRLASLPVPDRLLPIAIACLVLVASLLSVAPAQAPTGAVGSVNGAGTGPRIAIAGLNNAEAIGAVEGSGQPFAGDSSATTSGAATFSGSAANPAPAAEAAGLGANMPGVRNPEASPAAGGGLAAGQGPFLEDGTLLKPLAVDTSIQDGSASLQTYTVRSGDSLTSIANHFGISMMTVWWANDLRAKDELHVGQKLTIPPVTGLVVQVVPGDTLESIAADAHVSPDVIVSYNHLTDTVLIMGQTLIIPGGIGDPIPEPKASPAPSAPRSSNGSGNSGGSSGGSRPRSYTGGRFAWPVDGGGNYISQYFHYGHLALDIAAQYGTPVVAAASGTVIFAGWKNNGGGYQVWISHGGNLYTDYNHMSAITVGTGQSVGAGQQVGRIGMTGDATGPHLHFDVWIGMIWADGSYRVNPLNFF